MSKTTNSLGRKKLVKIIPVGQKQLRIYQYETGLAIGLCEIHCSLFRGISRNVISLERATERAFKLKDFYERTLTLNSGEYDKGIY